MIRELIRKRLYRNDGEPDMAHMAASSPEIVWLELTSKCPFSCVFCSRKTVRGNGEEMPWETVQTILRSLPHPEIIRLNYSGESVHHPHLSDTIVLAKERGATTELVSAFASISDRTIEALVRSGLDRLSISLHAIDPRLFQEIYGYSSIEKMFSRIALLRETRSRLKSRSPDIDFAFVATYGNLDELEKVVRYARSIDVKTMSIHPLLRRDDIPCSFSDEIQEGALTEQYKQRLHATIANLADTCPEVAVSVASPVLEEEPTLGFTPVSYARPLPHGARISGCDQDPWRTVHILSNGDVVPCEVLDRQPIGNVHHESLQEIWNGERYADFRRRYAAGLIPECITCPFKKAFLPGPLHSDVKATDHEQREFVRGWHNPEKTRRWSGTEGLLVLSNPGSKGRFLRIKGLLPPARNGIANVLQVSCNGLAVGEMQNDTNAIVQFNRDFPLPFPLSAFCQIRFTTSHLFRPLQEGLSQDQRSLGFALHECKVVLKSVLVPLLDALEALDRKLLVAFTGSAYLLNKRIRRHAPSYKKPASAWKPGISVIIPERENGELLRQCLASLLPALNAISEPYQVIIVVNGSPKQNYASLRDEYHQFQWLFYKKALGYAGAIHKGLKKAAYDWVYLLNNDMLLDAGTLREVSAWRSPHVFAIASQIFFRNSGVRREETGWGDMTMHHGLLEILDAMPADDTTVRGTLYAGGGASLFRKKLLRKFLDANDPYFPFYWEDVEWGVRAARHGYENLFCPASKVLHAHRATIGKLYAPEEVKRIFTRNKLLFQLRNCTTLVDRTRLLETVLASDEKTRGEIITLRRLRGIFKTQVKAAFAPFDDALWPSLAKSYYLKPWKETVERPNLVVVSPYGIIPPRHGGAIRLHRLWKTVAASFNIILLSDEAGTYANLSREQVADFSALHLVNGRKDAPGSRQDRIERIHSHSNTLLGDMLKMRLSIDEPDLVEMQYMELAGLVDIKRGKTPWILHLHDVLLSGSGDTPADTFERNLIRQFDQVIVCSPEDALLLGAGSRHAIIPNGASLSGVRYEPSKEQPFKLLFIGPFRYQPNIDGITAFLELVYPHLLREAPGIGIDILGGYDAPHRASRMRAFQQEGVRVHDYTPDVHRFLRDCSLTINPLHGIRGSSLKVIESLAAGRICVSTIEGARGFSDVGFQSLVTVPAIEGFLTPIRELLQDVQKRRNLEKPDAELLKQFSWEYAGSQLSASYHALME